MNSSELMIRRGHPALVLAPMEGVTDAPMRALLTERGGFTACVSEFMRISQNVPYLKPFYNHVPELAHGSVTPSGTRVHFQLLGGHAENLAIAAARACEAGAPGVDLNFGCPSPTVNGSDGGATLLKYPDRIRHIVASVRAAVPAHLPVSAKLRLGWDDMTQIHLNADRAVEGGASWITIHGRTKVQGYTPPAYWGPIGEVAARLPVPVIANGEIWTLDDFKRCRDETRAEHYMIGRGALADPTLQTAIARELGLPHGPHSNLENDPRAATRVWPEALDRFARICAPYYPEVFVIKRTKQWLSFARKGKGAIGLEGQRLFDGTKRLSTMSDILEFVRTPV